MPLIRSHEFPHCFCPSIAKELGITAAIVEYACRDLSIGQSEDGEEIKIPIKKETLIKYLYYLDRTDILESVTLLKNLHFSYEVV